MTNTESVDPELSEETDGALRVARRKALYSLQNMFEMSNRLSLNENGDLTRENSSENLRMGIAAQSDMLAENIEAELDRRGADYDDRSDIMS